MVMYLYKITLISVLLTVTGIRFSDFNASVFGFPQLFTFLLHWKEYRLSCLSGCIDFGVFLSYINICCFGCSKNIFSSLLLHILPPSFVVVLETCFLFLINRCCFVFSLNNVYPIKPAI